MKEELSLDDISSFEKSYSERKANRIAGRAVQKNGLYASAVDPLVYRKQKTVYSIDVDSGDVCNQRRSGRCWLFAGLNVVRAILMKKLNAKNIELSQAYLQYYDRLEKSNFVLDKAIKLAGEEYDSRLNEFILNFGNADGGYFEFFSSLVKKYGVVPIEEMPDGACSTDTTELNETLNALLHKDVALIRKAYAENPETDFAPMKANMLSEVYRLLAVALGEPVHSFSYQYRDKDNKFVDLGTLTPKEFYEKYIGVELGDYISLADYPIKGIEKHRKYTSEYVQNVVGGEETTVFQTSVQEMKDAVVAALKAGELVWFGADVVASSMRKEGLLAKGIYKLDEMLDLKFSDDKGENLMYRTNTCCHAMTFTGVNLADGKPDRWKVENSWGKENGKDGYFTMDDAWFDSYVYEVFVPKKYLPKELVEDYEKAKTEVVSPFVPIFLEMK